MFSALRRLFRRRPRIEVLYTKTQTAEERGKVWGKYEQVQPDRGRCPNCGHDKFYEGPEGPGAQNCQCVKCGLRWNVPSFYGIPWEFIGYNDARQEVEEMLHKEES